MRKRIFEIIELAGEDDRVSRIYDYTMMVAIVLSLVPLAFKEATSAPQRLYRLCCCIGGRSRDPENRKKF